MLLSEPGSDVVAKKGSRRQRDWQGRRQLRVSVLSRVAAGGVPGPPRSAEGCTQVIKESPCGRGYPEIQANKVVRTPYLCSASPPGHGSACPGVSAGRGNTEPLRSKLCFLFKKQDLAIVQPAGASCVYNLYNSFPTILPQINGNYASACPLLASTHPPKGEAANLISQSSMFIWLVFTSR